MTTATQTRRTCRLMAAPVDDLPGVLRIAHDRTHTDYLVRELPCDLGRCFAVEPVHASEFDPAVRTWVLIDHRSGETWSDPQDGDSGEVGAVVKALVNGGKL
jgi:hypothetical protein